MYRLVGFIVVAGFFFLVSCEKCMKCHYTYTVTTIVQTVNGEEEVVTSYTGYLYKVDSTQTDSIFDNECIKEGNFTIDQEYENSTLKDDLDNYTVVCTDL